MKHLPKAIVFLLLLSCTGDAGKIPITLDLSGVADTTQIKRFLFVVQDPVDPTGLSILFPSECTGCKTAVSPCAAVDVCVKLNDCGFEVTEGSFSAQVDFSDFPNNADMKLIACATNGAGAPIIAQGSSVVKNAVGQTANVVLTTGDTSCSVLPSVCP